MTKVTEYPLFERYSKQDHFTMTFASKQEVEFSQRAEYYCLWSRLDECREWPKRNSEVCFPDTLNAQPFVIAENPQSQYLNSAGILEDFLGDFLAANYLCCQFFTCAVFDFFAAGFRVSSIFAAAVFVADFRCRCLWCMCLRYLLVILHRFFIADFASSDILQWECRTYQHRRTNRTKAGVRGELRFSYGSNYMWQWHLRENIAK